MPTFDTPEPISVTVELGLGDIRIVASKRRDTTVEVRPSDPSSRADVTAAEQTRVECTGGRLQVKMPKGWRQWTFRGGSESIEVEIGLPMGSRVRAQAAIATLRCTGRLGECRYSTGLGDIQLEQAGPVELKTGVGDIAAGRLIEHGVLNTGAGAVQVGSIDGTAVIKNANGDTWIGDATGELRVNAANGKISVDHAHATVAARTALGDVRLGEVARGAILVQTGCGGLQIGVRDGVAAWLELKTQYGNVDNGLAGGAPPQPGEETVEVRARSAYGDIRIHRSGDRAFADGLPGERR